MAGFAHGGRAQQARTVDPRISQTKTEPPWFLKRLQSLHRVDSAQDRLRGTDPAGWVKLEPIEYIPPAEAEANYWRQRREAQASVTSDQRSSEVKVVQAAES